MSTPRFLSVACDLNGQICHQDHGTALVPWWSFTKTLIAACALIRAGEGLLDLDATLPGKPYTPRELMAHTSGLRDYGASGRYHAAVERGDAPWPVAQLWQEARGDDLLAAPGKAWCYSNLGYMSLRFALEVSEGAPLAEILHRRLVAPLGLKTPRLAQSPADFAELAWDSGGYHPGWVYHGCMMGSVTDAARLLQGILNGPLLSPAQRAEMQAPYMESAGIAGRIWTRTGYGLGLMIGEAEGFGRVLGHAGCGPFSGNLVAHFPDRGVTVASFARGGDEAPAEWEALRVLRMC